MKQPESFSKGIEVVSI